jgi:ferrochelatase
LDYDSILIVSFGGPEKHDEVIPFLENVLRGKNVPRERMLAVAEHYYRFDGRSPINDQVRALIAALRGELERNGPNLPIYWGNRNWRPLLADTLREMRADGRKRALAFVTSAYSSYSGCRQYREDIARAQAEVGEGAPAVDKLRVFYNHPGYIEPVSELVQAAFEQIPANRRAPARLFFTAHSIPVWMAETSDYEKQLREACRLVAARIGREQWQLVYQSRSGPPSQPWLEPDILDVLKEAKATDVVISPIGFLSDHLEVLYDLDTEARSLCAQLQLNMIRAQTVGVHPQFIAMIRELILERMGVCEKRALGQYGPRQDVCAADCCPAGQRR